MVNKILLLGTALCASGLAVAENLDDWGLDDVPENWLTLHYGTDDVSLDSFGVDATLALPAFSQLHMHYAEQQSHSEGLDDSRQWSAAWNSDPLQPWSWGFGYEKSGDKAYLRVENVDLGVHYQTRGELRFGLTLHHAELSQSFEGIPPLIEAALQDEGFAEQHRQGLGGTMNWLGEHSGVSIDYTYFFYQREDIDSETRSAVGESIEDTVAAESAFYSYLLYRGLYQQAIDSGLNDRQARNYVNALFVIYADDIRVWSQLRGAMHIAGVASALRQQTVVSKQNILGNYFYSWESVSLNVSVFAYEAYLVGEWTTQLSLGLDVPLAERWYAGLSLSQADDDSDAYLEVRLGVQW